MNIYNNAGDTTGRSKSKCSYCRAEGHNATQCPRVAEDYAYFTKSPPVIPIGVSTTTQTCHWFAQPRYWGEWFTKCKDAHAKQVTAKKRASSSPTRSARSAPKCGFCGSKDHNRRNCQAMDKYVLDAIEANRNWRRAFYQKFVTELGISEGALLNLKEKDGYWKSDKPDKELIGVVTSVNWDELSLFCSTKDDVSRYCYRDSQYKQNLVVTVQIGNETKTVSFGEAGIGQGIGSPAHNKNLVKYSGNKWNAPSFVSVLSPSESPIGEEWIEEGHAKAMAFLTKKRSQEKLDGEDVTALIKHWL